MKIVQYNKKCVGCGVCQELHPDKWRMSRKNGKAVLLGAITKKNLSILKTNEYCADILKLTASTCPVNAIKIC